MEANLEGQGEYFQFKARGELHLVGDSQEELALTFSAFVMFRGEDGQGQVSADGAAVVPIRGKMKLVAFGKHALVASVEEVE